MYRASFRLQKSNVIGYSSKAASIFKPLFYSGAMPVGKEVLKTGSNKITDILNKEPEKPVDDIFKNRFVEGKNSLVEKIKR